MDTASIIYTHSCSLCGLDKFLNIILYANTNTLTNIILHGQRLLLHGKLVANR